MLPHVEAPSANVSNRITNSPIEGYVSLDAALVVDIGGRGSTVQLEFLHASAAIRLIWVLLRLLLRWTVFDPDKRNNQLNVLHSPPERWGYSSPVLPLVRTARKATAAVRHIVGRRTRDQPPRA